MPVRSWLPAAAAACALVLPARAADASKELLNAARNGELAQVRSLVGAGASLKAKDKKGRTPLMQAVLSGSAQTVRFLLEKGADAQARDKSGFTPYGLALFSLGGSEREAVLAALPKPPRLRLSLASAWLAPNLVSSCFMSREELARLMSVIRPDALALGSLVEYARTSGLGLVDVVQADSTGPAADASSAPPPAANTDAGVALRVRPGASCVRQSDNLSLEIDVTVTRGGAAVFRKTFGSGLRGLHAQAVTNPTQYTPFFEKWARGHADSIYWDVVKVLMRQP